MPTSPHSAKRCHSEPVRTLAWESVSPRLPLRGRCQREALTEGEMPRVFLSPSRLRRQPPPRGGLTARRCRADGTSGTPSPTRGSTYRPVGRGPRAPPPGTHFSAGHMGPALQRKRIPAKTTRRPLRGAGTPSPTLPPPAHLPDARIPPDPAPRPARWAKGRKR